MVPVRFAGELLERTEKISQKTGFYPVDYAPLKEHLADMKAAIHFKNNASTMSKLDLHQNIEMFKAYDMPNLLKTVLLHRAINEEGSLTTFVVAKMHKIW